MDQYARRQSSRNHWNWTTTKRIKRNKDQLTNLWNNIKHTNIHIIGVPEGGEREKEAENILEDLRVENFPNMGKEIDIQVQEATVITQIDHECIILSEIN